MTQESTLTVVSVYNRYLNRGGEDIVFENEIALLERHGHRVIPVTAQVEVPKNLREGIGLGFKTLWSSQWYDYFVNLLTKQSVHVVHVHNYFPNMSPSIFYACRKNQVPVVHTLHNYRLVCPKNTLYRNGQVCEDCVRQIIPVNSIRYACYHDSRAQTATIAAMLAAHRLLKTWERSITLFIALTDFARRKFVEGGLPAHKVFVKPNFLQNPGSTGETESYALFVGRLSEEKGLHVLLKAWEMLQFPLSVAGDGPLYEDVQAAAADPGKGIINLLGRQTHADVLDLIARAQFLVMPSVWYEGFPMTIVEAFACGTPVIASRLGGMAEIVEDGRTGLHFTPGDAADLAAKVTWAREHPDEMAAMGRNARAEYEAKYTPERNYELLMAIYQTAMNCIT